MIAVILTAHVLIVIALIGVVLLQRSEGGALGMGGGGGGFMTGRGAANALTRTTSFLAALFFATSLALAIFPRGTESDATVLEELTGAPVSPAFNQGAPATAEDLLKTLGTDKDEISSGTDALEEVVGAAPADAAPAAGDVPPAAADAAEENPPAETEDGAPPEDSTSEPQLDE